MIFGIVMMQWFNFHIDDLSYVGTVISYAYLTNFNFVARNSRFI